MKLQTIVAALSFFALGCPSETKQETESTSEEAPKKKKKKKAVASASAAPKPERIDLSPLPATLELPPGAKVVEKSEKKAMVEIAGTRMTINVGFDLAAQKKTVETIPFDSFKAWVRDEKNAATAEMGSGTFRALKVFELGDKKFTCANVGVKGMKTAAEAEKMVAHCEKLEAKK